MLTLYLLKLVTLHPLMLLLLLPHKPPSILHLWLEVYNKVDASDQFDVGVSLGDDGQPWRVYVSALRQQGLDALLEAIALRLRPDMARLTIRIPAAAGRLRSRLFAIGAVHRETSLDNGQQELELAIPHEQFDRICRQEGIDPDRLHA